MSTQTHDISRSLEADLDYLLKLLRKVLAEYNSEVLSDFDRMRELTIKARKQDHADTSAFDEAQKFISTISVIRGQEIARAFSCYFHLANLAEELFRVNQIRVRENEGDFNELIDSYDKLASEVGDEEAKRRLDRLEFHPVLTAHPTEARRRAIAGKISRIGVLLTARQSLGGSNLSENERLLLNEIDAMFRTSPIALGKPTPVDENEAVISIFDTTLFNKFPDVARRLDNHLNKDEEGRKVTANSFVRLGSWIGADRDGNPNVSATVTRKVAKQLSDHVLHALADYAFIVGRNMTLENETTPPSNALIALWNKMCALPEDITTHPQNISRKETHRVVMLSIAKRISATAERNQDIGYQTPEKLLADLRIVQDSLLAAGANRSAYGPLQKLIWQVEIFGFHLAELEFRQHSEVHRRALVDLAEHNNDLTKVNDQTREVIDTFRALGAIQRRAGVRATRRYIVSFTQSAQHIADVYKLAQIAEADPDDMAIIDVIPLLETMNDLENCITILSGMIELEDVQRRLAQNGRKLEIMLGYSDSSKDVGPVAATFALHKAQRSIAKWAYENEIKLTLFHGRGGALGRGGGPAHRAVLAQPPGSVNEIFKLTEQGETIFARYGNPDIAVRHIESVAAATLLNSAPSVEKENESMTQLYSSCAEKLTEYSRDRFHELVQTDGFPSWFAHVTPLEEVGMLPIGSRPAKRGLSVNSLDDLRAIPWVFAWSQARINLAAWYGFGTACAKLAEEHGADHIRAMYKDWNLFTTMVDNIEMSIAKADERIATLYLNLGDNERLAHLVLDELHLTREWVSNITGNSYPLENRRVLGQAVQIRGPYVDALSLLQVATLRSLRNDETLDEQTRGELRYLLLCTVNGVAAGLQNTG